jgi:8-oxo-dGTP pyrophosphatase MutT (NUDIX family)
MIAADGGAGDRAPGQRVQVYGQSAVVPFRFRSGRLEVLLVSNQRGSRWVLPKGLVEEDLSPAESAAREAYEEAGAAGEVSAGPVGCYTYPKWGGTCEVEVFLLAVDTLYEDWPERGCRARRWVSSRQALDEVDARVPRALLRDAFARAAGGGG